MIGSRRLPRNNALANLADELSAPGHFKVPLYPIEGHRTWRGSRANWVIDSGWKTGCGVTAHDVGCTRFVQENPVNPAGAPDAPCPKEHP